MEEMELESVFGQGGEVVVVMCENGVVLRGLYRGGGRLVLGWKFINQAPSKTGHDSREMVGNIFYFR